MSERVRIELEPLGRALEVERGTPLREVLFPYGVEFPCGGRGRCKRCRVRVLAGELPAGPDEQRLLSAEDLRQGWRLACHARAEAALTLEIAQWETAILADDSRFEFTPREGLGIAVDLGTTTLVAQLLDLTTARVLGIRTALNPQAAYGADIMSRVQLALSGEGRRKLMELIRERIGGLATELAGPQPVADVAIVGNAVMHHLFCGIDVEPLSHVPFHPSRDGLEVFEAAALGWRLAGAPRVRFLPCLGGFVGSDILAGLLATRIPAGGRLAGLIDLGTNGEIVFGRRGRMLCASAAAGPAFEGGRIGMGMRAASGAIAEVEVENGGLRCYVLGNTAPRGICGSGLVDAVAGALELGAIRSNGRLAGGALALAPGVTISQSDIRELQLAKAAVAAGVRILLKRLGAAGGDVERLYLAGAFGNYVKRASAWRIGLIDFPEEKVEPAGNTALLGAKLALFAPEEDYSGLRAQVEHLSLAADAEFQDTFVEEMAFPGGL